MRRSTALVLVALLLVFVAAPLGLLAYVSSTIPGGAPDPLSPSVVATLPPTIGEPPPATTTPAPPAPPTTLTVLAPSTTGTTARPAPAPPTTAVDVLAACTRAIARNTAPLAPGASERCSGSPVYAWGATDGRTIFYGPERIQVETGGLAWDYVVAHERGHVRRFASGSTDWADEGQADAEARRYYPAATERWTVYR